MAENNSYEIVYDSDFIIEDPVELSTLCVFYDKVYLPYRGKPKPKLSRGKGSDQAGDSLDAQVAQPGELEEKERDALWQREEMWERENGALFTEGVLKRLPISRAKSFGTTYSMIWLAASQFLKQSNDQFLEELSQQAAYTSSQTAKVSVDKFALAAYHGFREDISLSRFSTGTQNQDSTEFLKGVLAGKTFQYVLPVLSDIGPEGVLEVREKVSGLREGFSLHLQTLTDYIDIRLKKGDSVEDIAGYAQKVVERKIEPQYREYKRQLGSIHAVGGRKLLDAGYRIAIVSGLALTMSHWIAGIAAGLSSALTISELLHDGLSNERQAYQFMHIVENTIDK